MSKLIEVQQFIQETMMNFGRIDFVGVLCKTGTAFINLKGVKWTTSASTWARYLDERGALVSAEAVITTRHSVVLILNSSL